MRWLAAFALAPLASLMAEELHGSIERLDPAFDRLVPTTATIEKCAEGFTWAEGPVWYQKALVFSDVPENVIYRWQPGDTVAAVFLKPSGMLKPRAGFQEPGSNGLTVDTQGRLIICQHGEQRVARVEKDGSQTVLASHFEGKRFNSPNDAVVRRNGDVYFTDPPYGLEGLNRSPLKELPFNGVYRVVADGTVTLLTKELTFPNGLAFSPDEKTLYVAVSDPKNPRVMAYDVQADGTLAGRRLFFDAAPLFKSGRRGLPDGLKVDATGHVFATGPGGVLVLSPTGQHLGTLLTGQNTANCGWGEDGSVLYLCADMFLCRVQTATKGAGW